MHNPKSPNPTVGEVLEALAARCEAATGPDRELDREIASVAGWCPHPRDRQRDDSAQSDTGYTCLDCGADSWGNTGPSGQKRSAPLPAYTTSLDAAMTLVPVKPFPELRPGEWWWSVDSLGCDAHVAYENHDSGIPEYSGRAATPALSLCAAALRARADFVRATS